MRQAIIQHGFLPVGFYLDLRNHLPLTIRASSVRSHNDLHQGDPECKRLLRESQAWMEKEAMVPSATFWQPYVDLIFGKSEKPAEFPFIESFCEARSGKILEPGRVFYARMDIGDGKEGYGRDNGGLGLHIDNSDGKVEHEIPVSENLAVLTVQKRYAHHKVRPVTKLITGRPRIALYFALCATYKFWPRTDQDDRLSQTPMKLVPTQT